MLKFMKNEIILLPGELQIYCFFGIKNARKAVKSRHEI